MKNENYVNMDDVVEIKDNQVAVIGSRACGEIIVLIPAKNKPFGFRSLVSKEYNMEAVKDSLQKMDLKGKIFEIELNDEGEAYVCPEGFTDGKTLCVKEMEEGGEKHLKLCVVIVPEKKVEEEDYMEM